jgi:hypothetical protein
MKAQSGRTGKGSAGRTVVQPAGRTKNKGGKGSSGRTTTTQGVYRPTGGVEIESYRYEKRKPTAKKAAAKKKAR